MRFCYSKTSTCAMKWLSSVQGMGLIGISTPAKSLRLSLQVTGF